MSLRGFNGARRAWVPAAILGLVSTIGCGPPDILDPFSSADDGESGTSGATQTGDGDAGDGDGDGTSAGDGDGTSTGDGDGTSTGDGDGTSTGDGDGTGGMECGNGVIEGFENCDCGTDGTCDPAELGGTACGDLMDPISGNIFDGGDLGCNLSCIHDTTQCFVCGDGTISPGEPCDGPALGTSTCGTEGFLGGTLTCNTDCSLDTSMCTMATWTETFETGDFLASPWSPGGSAYWTIDGTEAAGGMYSAKAPSVTTGSSDLAINLDIPTNGTVAFAYKLATNGSLGVYFGATLQDTYFGTVDWTDVNLPHPGGTVRVIFRYNGTSGSANEAWIDSVRSDGTPVAAVCGDGWLTYDEQCDGPNVGLSTCGSYGFLGGLLGCDLSCMVDTASCTTASWTETWESTDFTAHPWQFAGAGNWMVDNADASEGTYSAVSPPLADGQSADLSVEMDFAAAGTLGFTVASDTDSGDGISFILDGAEQDSWQGTQGWTDAQYAIPAGKHAMTWRFAKDAAGAGGTDSVRLDNLRSDGADCTDCNVCGDAYLGLMEVCDGALLGTHTCGTEGFLGGTLVCDGACALDTSACTMATWSENWETGDFTANPWTQGGTTGWEVDGTSVNGGSFSAHSGTITDSQTSDLSLSMTFAAAGTVVFAHQTDTESCCDHLQFLVDGLQVGTNISGSTAWAESSFPVPAGTHMLTWRYTKDGSVSTGNDRVWIDDIRSDGTVP